MNTKQILIMDDDEDYGNYLSDVAESLNISCKVTNNLSDFMTLFTEETLLLFLDLNMPDVDGIGLLSLIQQKPFKCNIVLMSGADDRIIESAESFARSLNLSVIGRFQKTIRLAELEMLLKKWVEQEKPTNEPPKAQPTLKFTVTEEELKRAINNDEFVVYYQPKIEIASKGFYGVEALIRWIHPEHQLVPPDHFIKKAESLGMIDEISWLIMKKAIQEINKLQNTINLPFKLALNLSPYSLHDFDFPNKFVALIQELQFPPENVVIEITETGLINELSSALAIFTRFRLKNIQLSIDDFGTGYSMMQQLKIIPANEIKVDQSFVQNMLLEQSSRVTVEKVIEIGHELGMKVVAEGVETKEQLLFLQQRHCDIGQGYFFSKPIPLSELKQWIETNYGANL